MSEPVDIDKLDKDIAAMQINIQELARCLKAEKATISTLVEKMCTLETSNNYRLTAFEKWKESMEPMQLQMVQLQFRIDVLVSHIDQLKLILTEVKSTGEQHHTKFENITRLSNSVTNATKEILRLRKDFELAVKSLSVEIKTIDTNTSKSIQEHQLKLDRIMNVKTIMFALGTAILGAVTLISLAKDWIHIK